MHRPALRDANGANGAREQLDAVARQLCDALLPVVYVCVCRALSNAPVGAPRADGAAHDRAVSRITFCMALFLDGIAQTLLMRCDAFGRVGPTRLPFDPALNLTPDVFGVHRPRRSRPPSVNVA